MLNYTDFVDIYDRAWSKPCLVVRQNMDIFDECELIWLPNVLPLNKGSNQQHYGLKLYKYETM